MRKVKLSGGVYYALVDTEDYKRVIKYKWHYEKGRTGMEYAKSVINGEPVRLHVFILGSKRKLVVDHIDRDGLNNQKHNLRHTTKSLNGHNSISIRSKSGYKGVYYDPTRNKYLAMLTVNTSKYNLGRYDTAKEANEVCAAFKRKYGLIPEV